MNGRWIVLTNNGRGVDRAFIADAPGSDLAVREAIIKMAVNGMDIGDVLKITEGQEDCPPDL